METKRKETETEKGIPKTAKEIRQEHWSGHDQWRIYRIGKSDGIVVLICNPPYGRNRCPFIKFKIFQNGEEVTEEYSYANMRKAVNDLRSNEK